MAMSIMYNGIQFAPVSTRQSIVVPHSAEVLWSVVGQFSKQALWMGTVEGQPIFTQLLVCSPQNGLQSLPHTSLPCTVSAVWPLLQSELPATSFSLQGGETADFVGAVRVFGIADKLLFEQLTGLDNQEMTM